ncbi:MAG: hypothetical protein HC819_24615, partial [Cyclobacteriaceae bacterium]|nr:hypothetical protein [Cyclobacteriaceae bacterium]
VLVENPPSKSLNLGQYFCRVLRDELKVPVAMVIVAFSGTNQAAWMSRETLEAFPGDGGAANFYQSFLAEKEKGLAAGKDGPKSFEEFKQLETGNRIYELFVDVREKRILLYPAVRMNSK